MRNLIYFITGLSLLFLFTNCQGTSIDDDFSTSHADDIPSFSSCTWENPHDFIVGNQHNPFDGIGQEHNDFQCTLEDQLDLSMDMEEVYLVIDDLVEQLYGRTKLSSKKYSEGIFSYLETEQQDVLVAENASDSFNETLLLRLINILGKYDGTNLEEVVAEIKRTENKALNLNSPQSIKQFLKLASIGRFSVSYWHEGIGSLPVRIEKKVFGKSFLSLSQT